MSQRRSGRRVRVAAVQMPFEDDVGENFETMAEAIRRLARKRVRLAVFPECCLNGYLVPAGRRDWAAAADALRELRRMAADYRMALIFGLAERTPRGLPLNSALAVDEHGRLVARYSKQHLISWDRRFFSPGRLPARAFRLAGLRVVMQVCFDLRFPEPVRLAALRGAELVAYCFAATGRDEWKRPVLEGHLRSRAAENGVFAVGANRLGRSMMMNSRIVDPDGLDLAAAPFDRPAVIVADVSPALARRALLAQRRTDLYSLRSR